MTENFSDLVARRLRELGMSRADLARKAGVSRTYIGMIVNATAKSSTGFHRPKPEILAKIATALQLSEAELLSSMGYRAETHAADSHDLDGVFVSFDGATELTDDEQRELLQAVRLIAAGIRARKTRD